MSVAFLGLGSNMGDRKENLTKALQLLSESAGQVQKISRIYETQPWGVKNQENYFNMAVQIETKLWPLELLYTLLRIEHDCGRERKERWDSRTLDIDLLLYEAYRFTMPELVVPHPRFRERNFVLHPMAEIAPHRIDPGSRLSLTQLKEQSPDKGWIRPCEF